MTGLPVPHVAIQAVGMPARLRSILKPFFSRMPVRYFVVSNSWKPGSAKLKTMSFMRCRSSFWPSTSRTTSRLFCSSFGFGGAAGRAACAGAAGCCAASDAVATRMMNVE